MRRTERAGIQQEETERTEEDLKPDAPVILRMIERQAIEKGTKVRQRERKCGVERWRSNLWGGTSAWSSGWLYVTYSIAANSSSSETVAKLVA